MTCVHSVTLKDVKLRPNQGISPVYSWYKHICEGLIWESSFPNPKTLYKSLQTWGEEWKLKLKHSVFKCGQQEWGETQREPRRSCWGTCCRRPEWALPPPTQSPNFNLWPEPKTKIPIRTHHIWRSFRRKRRGRGHSGDRDTQLTFSITGSFRDFMQPFKIKLSCSVWQQSRRSHVQTLWGCFLLSSSRQTLSFSHLLPFHDVIALPHHRP